MRGNTLWPGISMVLSMFFWGSSLVAAKYALAVMHPLLLMFARLAIACLVFVPLLPALRRVRLQRKDAPLLLAMALCEPCLYFVFEGYALRLTSASQAGVVTALAPVMVAVGAMIFFKERQDREIWAGLLLALAGVVWLSLSGSADETSPHPALGNILEFFAICSTTGYVLLVKRLAASYPPLYLSAAQSFIGVAFFLVLLLVRGVPLPDTLPPGAVLATLWLGTFVSFGAYALYNFGVARVTATQAGVYVYLIPAFAVLQAWVLLGERLTPWQWLAAMLVLAGVFICQRRYLFQLSSNGKH